MGKTNVPPGLDVEGVIGYDQLPDLEDTERIYENKASAPRRRRCPPSAAAAETPACVFVRLRLQSVVVFGMGNAAMETSKNLMPYVQFVHVFSGSKNKEYPLTCATTFSHPKPTPMSRRRRACNACSKAVHCSEVRW
eukprot:SAG11_NODE_652_length_7925_cov_3.950166_3_plen_137_part_00